VIIFIIHHFNICTDEPESNPPIGLHCDRPNAFTTANQFMQALAGKVHVFGRLGDIKIGKNPVQFGNMPWLNTRLATGFVKSLQSLVYEADYHVEM